MRSVTYWNIGVVDTDENGIHHYHAEAGLAHGEPSIRLQSPFIINADRHNKSRYGMRRLRRIR